MVVSRFLIYSRVTKVLQYDVKLTISTLAEIKSGRKCFLASNVILSNNAHNTLQKHQINVCSLSLKLFKFIILL